LQYIHKINLADSFKKGNTGGRGGEQIKKRGHRVGEKIEILYTCMFKDKIMKLTKHCLKKRGEIRIQWKE
jgi:hypothetical protein